MNKFYSPSSSYITNKTPDIMHKSNKFFYHVTCKIQGTVLVQYSRLEPRASRRL